MTSSEKINLIDKESGLFLADISLSDEEIHLTSDRKLAKDFEWYSWFYYKVFIWIILGRVVNRSTIIEVIGG